ncbi:hypothetical protein HUT19_26800 [Streptomyces sp. NA02950]|uniref:hypothetical protein n=1 Tax=Streptomyces sp. NA02950 TaxID=2742137 RepID=UPI0015902BEE|nr:hypothetical protein [Streptomyces sp. NA02950]QKV94909.1 hypothetical protein HUT19_26800 [Streptomyces sp. NA02950]
MPLFDDEVSASAARLLEESGFTRLLAVPAFPVGSPQGFRYPLRTKASDGSEWYVRSWGTDFQIANRAWLRRGLSASFSLGWAVLPEGQTDRLLMIETFETDGPSASEHRERVLGCLEPYVRRSAVAESSRWGRTTLRIAALLRSDPQTVRECSS